MREGAGRASFTVGVAIVQPGTEAKAAVLWEQADAALYEGKRTGAEIVVFDDVAELLSIVTPAKVQALRSLLDEPRLEIAFQPIWDLQDGRVLGLEALARPWAGYGFEARPTCSRWPRRSAARTSSTRSAVRPRSRALTRSRTAC